MDEALKWVEQHPTMAAVIGVGGAFILLWLLGFFSSSSGSSANSGASNLAAAYYAAEAAQTTAGTNLQIASIQATAATQQNADQVNGAVAIANANATAATTINGQNASSATTIAGYGAESADVASNNQVLMTYSNNAAAVATNASNNYYASQIATTNANASITNTYLSQVVSPELQLTGGAPFAGVDPTGRGVNVGVGPPSINALISEGYSSVQAEQIARDAGWTGT